MTTWLRYGAQAAMYAVFAAIIGYFANAPAYTHFPPDRGFIRLSFSHSGQRPAECRRLTPDELAKLPHNLRKPLDCPRGRVPVYVALLLDGTPVYEASLRPTGVTSDGPSHVHVGFRVAPGSHRIEVKMRDSARSSGFNYERLADVTIAPGQNFVIDFRSGGDGFVFR